MITIFVYVYGGHFRVFVCGGKTRKDPIFLGFWTGD